MTVALLHLLTSTHGVAAYSLVFGVLVACGLGLPLPEDVALVTGGYLSFVGAANLWLMFFFAFAGILAGDLIVYAAGRRYGSEVAHVRLLRRFFTDEKRARVESYFHRYGQGLVMGARFLPGLRVVTYFSAGASEMGAWRFLFFDGLAACVSAPLWLFIGRRLGRQLQTSLLWVSRAHWILMILAGVVSVAGLIIVLRRNGAAATGTAKAIPPRPTADAPRERTGS